MAKKTTFIDVKISGDLEVDGSKPDPNAHKTSHENGSSDEISVAGLSGVLADNQNPTTHKTSHENGGGDEISVADLSGVLADNQNPTTHDLGSSAHGTDTLANFNTKLSDANLDDSGDPRDPNNHAGGHTDGTDDIQNATTLQKGLATAAQITKLNDIEEYADVTDYGNVAAAGAFMQNWTPTKGDIPIRSGTTYMDRLPVGINDRVLTADSVQLLGVEWKVPRPSYIFDRVSTAVSNNTAAMGPHYIYGVTDTSASRTITISTADMTDGRNFLIKDESGGAGSNNITIATEGAQTIDGAASVTISVDYGVARLYSNGTNLFSF